MKSEFLANSILDAQRQIKAIQNNIRNHYGIVPASWYDELQVLETKLEKATKNDQ